LKRIRGPENKQSSTEAWDEVWNSYARKRYEYHLALEGHSVRWQRSQQIVLDKYGSFSGLNCIELGAGSGHYSMLFVQRGEKVTLLKYSKNALNFSQTLFKDRGTPESNVQFICML